MNARIERSSTYNMNRHECVQSRVFAIHCGVCNNVGIKSRVGFSVETVSSALWHGRSNNQLRGFLYRYPISGRATRRYLPFSGARRQYGGNARTYKRHAIVTRLDYVARTSPAMSLLLLVDPPSQSPPRHARDVFCALSYILLANPV